LAEATIPPPIDDSGCSPAPFLPEPNSIRALDRLTLAIKDSWIKAFHKELRGLINTLCAVSNTDTPSGSDRVMPVKELFKCKLDQHGNIDKLKCRIVFRGDLYHPEDPMDSWNPHATWFVLRVYLAMCAHFRMFPSQTDFIMAYLQVKMKERVFVRFPDSWLPYVPDDLQAYCNRPLLLLKALYGYTYSGKFLYEEQSSSLLSACDKRWYQRFG
jgi:hypothetical protein